MNVFRLVREYRQLSRHPRSGLTTTAIVLIIVGVVVMVLLMIAVVLAALLLPAIQQARTAARRTQASNNLKQIGLAMHNYHDVYKQWAPGGIYEPGSTKGRHGWMTSILPFVEQTHLYDQIDFNAYWDSPRNAAIFTNRVPMYHTPLYDGSGIDVMTTAAGFSTAHFAGNSDVLVNNGGLGIRDITDGTSNTALAAQVGGGFMAWGDPENRRSFENGLGTGGNQFGSIQGDTFQVLLADGSVRNISYNVDPSVLRGIGTRDGSEALGDF